MKWICCQLGAREHYAVPRALHARGALERLVTDFWIPPKHPLSTLNAGLAQRFHSDLNGASVVSSNLRSALFELRGKVARLRGWQLVMARNESFQRAALKHLQVVAADGKPRVLFAYSYAARELFRFARARGWHTVLGQIDPGLHEEKLVQGLYGEAKGEFGTWQTAPARYWNDWRTECELADCVMVNSEWARQGLLAEGIPAGKIHTVPLAYEFNPTKDEKNPSRRDYPSGFTTRPLRVLFLGQVNLRKGVRPLFEAVRQLAGEPIEFWFVGPVQIRVPIDLRGHPNVRWFGAVSREGVAKYFQEADVFILPTFSDGFALTQLEAISYHLPVIASPFCGEVVRNGVDGIVLSEVSASAIAEALRRILAAPELLRHFSSQAEVRPEFSLSSLGQRLQELEPGYVMPLR